ncbi:MAG: glycoside hydrolase family 2 protein [Clostridia bacterium]|nr:glycoside hydrolase family 2 protein [Clostridia bacterium]
MKRMDLNGRWQMICSLGQGEATVPGDYYTDLLAWGVIPEPYEQENAVALRDLPIDPVYTRSFTYAPSEPIRRAVLRFHGVDTLATVTLNGQVLGETDNCHCRFDYDVTDLLTDGDNVVAVAFRDPRPWYAEWAKEHPNLRGSDESLSGYHSIRKAHFTAGWDFAPQMVNAGLFRPVGLLLMEEASFDGVTLRQQTDPEAAHIVVKTRVNATHTERVTVAVTVTDPDGAAVATARQAYDVNGPTRCDTAVTVEQPRLWWPNGLGDQPLYTVITTLLVDGREVDRDEKTLGLRSLVVSTAADAYGREFTFTVNGVTPFIMGGNYIPEDCMPSRWSRERTRRLLTDCAEAHFNMIRVWGGGYYPEDWFFDLCDELGLLVWQDVMYACCFPDDDPDLIESTKRELDHNLWRFSHRSCLALICGNNEMEEAMMGWAGWCELADETVKATYLKIFEHIIPDCLKMAEVDVTYIPSSPTSGGGFDDPGDRMRMDCHDWQAFHGKKPYEVYRDYESRFLSEFGFQSLPSAKSLGQWMAQPLGFMTPGMGHRQSCRHGNGYLMERIADYFRVPDDFSLQAYLSQRLQADMVDYVIRHLRRHRGQCMGSLYWQVNDCWPGISWSSIDYDGRWKALQYAAREFYAPHLLVLTEEEGKVTVSVVNESTDPFVGRVKWRLLRNDLTVLDSGEYTMQISPRSAADIGVCDFTPLSDEQRRTCVVTAVLVDSEGSALSEQTVRFVRAKDFAYLPPHVTAALCCEDGGYALTLQADAFVQDVWLEFGHTDCIFSRNGFSLTGDPVTVTLSRVEGAAPSVEDLTVQSLNRTV